MSLVPYYTLPKSSGKLWFSENFRGYGKDMSYEMEYTRDYKPINQRSLMWKASRFNLVFEISITFDKNKDRSFF